MSGKQVAASVVLLMVLVGAMLAAGHKASTADGAKSLEAAAEQLGETFENFEFERVEQSEIPGVIEIYAGDQLIYYAPKQEILIFGEFFSKDGESITATKVQALRNAKAKHVDTDQALTIGEGELHVSIFTNPECPYCRKLTEWLAEQDLSHVTQHWFFMLPKGNAIAEAKAKQAICAEGKEGFARIQEAHSRAFPEKELLDCADAAERLAAHDAVANKAGAFATPYIVINGEAVAGFDPAKLRKLLKL